MPTTRHNEKVADFLRANAGLGVTVVAGPLREDMDDKIVACVTTGGEEPSWTYGNFEDIKFATVQCLVRGHHTEHAGCEGRANTVWETLRNSAPSGTDKILCEQSSPIYMGADGQGRPMYAVNVRVQVTE